MRSPDQNQLFTPALWTEILALVSRLSPEQKLWLSGFLSGSANTLNASATETGKAPAKVLIAYGSETGNSERLAQQLSLRAKAAGIDAQVSSLSDIRVRQLARVNHLLVICSTHGDGDPPEPIHQFFDTLMENPGPDLSALNYAVLALGDSSYEHFCATGRQLDERFRELKASPLLPRMECDVDYAEAAENWSAAVLERLGAKSVSAEVEVIPPVEDPQVKKYSKTDPLTVEIFENIRLSHQGRPDPIHHISLALEADSLSMAPGDAIGVLGENPPALVSAVLKATGLSGEHPVNVEGKALPLVQALREARDLTVPGQRFLESWSQCTRTKALEAILAEESSKQREFLRAHQVIDLITQFPGKPDAQMLVDTLRPLQPRLYDIASSLRFIDDELQIVVQRYNYPFRNRTEQGIASNYLLNADPGDSIRIYPHSNLKFRLPEQQDSPLILIAEGTGIAPFRSFIQEMKAQDQPRSCWLIFGEQQFEQDFLYQTELHKAHAEGLLTFVDSVFYQDQPKRTLASPLIEQSERLVSWLEDGAHVYFCGNRSRLGECESAIRFWLESVSQKAALWQALNSEKRIHRNLY
jgi:sulfite reductase (NADPH) flavoprotein alpha-component